MSQKRSTGQTHHYEVNVGPGRWARCTNATSVLPDGRLQYVLHDGRKGVAARDEWCAVYSAPVKAGT